MKILTICPPPPPPPKNNNDHIKITNTTPRVQYVANGLQNEFPFIFQIIQQEDLEVYLGDQKQSSNYTVSGAGQSSGGTIVLNEPPSAGTIVTLVRNTPIQRTSDFQQSGAFQAKVLNDELDLLTAALQDVAESVRRSVRLPVVDTDASLDLPGKGERANGFLGFDADGNARVTASTGSGDGPGIPGGADAQVQFNDGGSFGGASGLTYAKSTHTLSVGGSVRVGTIAEKITGAGVAVEGLLVRDGLIDGRNVSSDGAKLDGIAPGAIDASGVTFENLDANGDIGPAADQVASGDHRHDTDYSSLNHDHDGAYAASGHSHDMVYAGFTHAQSHAATGNDPLRLDGLAEPDDTAELDASTSKHGLLPKLSGNGGEYLDGLGNWSTPPAGNSVGALAIDEANYSLNFFDAEASYLEAGAAGALCTQGTPSFPNRVGDGVNVTQGAGYDGTHVSGGLWRSADGGYVAGSADFAGILGGYDCLNNQIGGWICGSNHSTMRYNVEGHSYIGGGSSNLIESGRSAILGSTACAITGNSGYSAIVAGRDCLIDSNYYSLVVGQDNTLNGGSGSLVVGNDITVNGGHNRASVLGSDVTTTGPDTLTRGSANLVTTDDVRVWSQIFKKRTTDASLANMDAVPSAFPAGKVFAGHIKVKMVGLRDGGANGHNDGDYSQVALAGETSFMWDETNDTGNFNGGPNSAGPIFNLSVVGTDKIAVGTCQLAVNTGKLRLKVTGKASTTINWVATMEVVSTAVVL